MLRINETVSIPLAEIDLTAIRSQGPGGQNVNKVASAIHLRFDFAASEALSEENKACLLQAKDRRISRDGTIVIKAQRYRSQDKNREDALSRLQELLADSLQTRKPRKKTSPSAKARRKRLDDKSRRGTLKQLRSKPDE